MNSNSIRKLRKKFILVAMVSIALVMFFMSSFINIANVLTSNAEIHSVLDYLCKNDGELPTVALKSSNSDSSSDSTASSDSTVNSGSTASSDSISDSGSTASSDSKSSSGSTSSSNSRSSSGSTSSAGSKGSSSESNASPPETSEDDGLSFFGVFNSNFSSNAYSPEFKYSTRYFAVLFDSSDNVTEVITSHIAAVDDDQAEQFARYAMNRFFKFGSYGVYYYEVREESDGSIIVVFLNCSTQVSTNLRIFYMTLIICFGGLIIVFWLVYILSNRLIQPEIENVEKQKQFITNASHELKTPLAVIRANTEIEEMMNGENEWSQSTMRQVDRMNGLIQNLVMISRSDEQADKTVLTDTDITKAVGETIDTFESVAIQDNKKLVRDLGADIHMSADESSIRQLTSVLIDNAIKYCDDEGTISVQLSKKSKTVRLVISNSYKDGANTDYNRFFDRFYRKDEAHNVDKGGYGIGLSIAENIVHRYKGTISASWKDGIISFTCLLS